MYNLFIFLKRVLYLLIQQYLIEGNNTDVPGNFISYLIQHNKVKAFVFERNRYGIGTVESYNKVQAIYNNI